MVYNIQKGMLSGTQQVAAKPSTWRDSGFKGVVDATANAIGASMDFQEREKQLVWQRLNLEADTLQTQQLKAIQNANSIDEIPGIVDSFQKQIKENMSGQKYGKEWMESLGAKYFSANNGDVNKAIAAKEKSLLSIQMDENLKKYAETIASADPDKAEALKQQAYATIDAMGNGILSPEEKYKTKGTFDSYITSKKNDVIRAQKQAIEQQKIANNEVINDLYTRAIDGTLSREELDTAKNSGVFKYNTSSYRQILKSFEDKGGQDDLDTINYLNNNWDNVTESELQELNHLGKISDKTYNKYSAQKSKTKADASAVKETTQLDNFHEALKNPDLTVENVDLMKAEGKINADQQKFLTKLASDRKDLLALQSLIKSIDNGTITAKWQINTGSDAVKKYAEGYLGEVNSKKEAVARTTRIANAYSGIVTKESNEYRFATDEEKADYDRGFAITKEEDEKLAKEQEKRKQEQKERNEQFIETWFQETNTKLARNPDAIFDTTTVVDSKEFGALPRKKQDELIKMYDDHNKNVKASIEEKNKNNASGYINELDKMMANNKDKIFPLDMADSKVLSNEQQIAQRSKIVAHNKMAYSIQANNYVKSAVVSNPNQDIKITPELSDMMRNMDDKQVESLTKKITDFNKDVHESKIEAIVDDLVHGNLDLNRVQERVLSENLGKDALEEVMKVYNAYNSGREAVVKGAFDTVKSVISGDDPASVKARRELQNRVTKRIEELQSRGESNELSNALTKEFIRQEAKDLKPTDEEIIRSKNDLYVTTLGINNNIDNLFDTKGKGKNEQKVLKSDSIVPIYNTIKDIEAAEYRGMDMTKQREKLGVALLTQLDRFNGPYGEDRRTVVGAVFRDVVRKMSGNIGSAQAVDVFTSIMKELEAVDIVPDLKYFESSGKGQKAIYIVNNVADKFNTVNGNAPLGTKNTVYPDGTTVSIEDTETSDNNQTKE